MGKELKSGSEATLRSHIQTRIRELGEMGLFISGSFVHTGRKCGSKTCACASGGPKHPCCLLTSKVAGKTKSVYVPVDMAEEVEQWVAEHKRLKRLLEDINELGERLIRIHVAARERGKSNQTRVKQVRDR